MKLKAGLVILSAAALFLFIPSVARPTDNSTKAPGAGISVVRVPNGGIQPQAIAENGTLHLLYYSGDPKAGDLFYVRSKDWGGSWSSPIRVNSHAGSALALGTIRGGQMAIGRKGRVHVAWNGSSAVESEGPMNPEAGKRGAPMLYARINDAGTGFEAERNLMTRTFGLDGGGTLAADSAGNVYVAWHGKALGAAKGEAGRQVWLSTSHDDGKGFEAERSAWNSPTGACGCCGMAMFADSTGVVRALYRSATEDVHRDIYLLSSANQGKSFDGRKLHTWDINACPMSSMEFAQGGREVVGAWETGGQVYFEELARKEGVPVSAPGPVGGRKHPRIAVDPSGEVLMIWTEGTGWQKGGALAWQKFAANGSVVGDRGGMPGVPTWSFGAVVAHGSAFVVLY